MVPRQQRALTRKPTPPQPFFLLAACLQQVPQEELLVPLQHPFRGDVSPLYPMRSSVPFDPVGSEARGSPQTQQDRLPRDGPRGH